MDLTFPPAVERLPRHRARLESACRVGMAEPAVVGMAIGGSFAGGRPDELSDLDLRLVVEDDAFERMLDRRRAIAEAAGPLVAAFTGGHVGEERLLITLYADLVHVDYLVVGVSDVAEHNAGHAVLVLWERDGRLSAVLPGERRDDPVEELTWMEARMWTWVWYTQSKILRGELYEAIDALNVLRAWVVFRLTARTAGVPYRAARFAEEVLGEHAQTVALTATGPAREALIEGLRATVRLYLALAEPLLERQGVTAEGEARRVVLAALDRGLDWTPPPA
jgi:hypothetical protein